MSKTKIEWSQESWNPTTGCKQISSGCAHCYAKRIAERFRGKKGHPFEKGFDIQIHEKRLSIPFHWRKPRLVFVDSMSDLFLDEIPDDFILKVFNVISETPTHTYQVLTKRPERMLHWLDTIYKKPLPDNLWLGVTVENDEVKDRISLLKKTTSKVKFLSIEPLIGEINLTEELLQGIDWVIVGGETGPGARQMKKEWVDSIYSICNKLDIPFFFKHWGAFGQDGRKLKPKELKSVIHERLYKNQLVEEFPKGYKL